MGLLDMFRRKGRTQIREMTNRELYEYVPEKINAEFYAKIGDYYVCINPSACKGFMPENVKLKEKTLTLVFYADIIYFTEVENNSVVRFRDEKGQLHSLKIGFAKNCKKFYAVGVDKFWGVIGDEKNIENKGE